MQAWEYVKKTYEFDSISKNDLICLTCPSSFIPLPNPDYCDRRTLKEDKNLCTKCWEREVKE